MKQWLIGLVLFLLLIIACIYIFIPGKIEISSAVNINANQQSTFRFLSDKNNWRKWWPRVASNNSSADTVLRFDGYEFLFNKVLYNAFNIGIKSDNEVTNSLFQVLSYSVDSIKIQWTTKLDAGINPFKRVRRYVASKRLHAHFNEILMVAKKHISSLKNLYGIDIKKEKVQFQYLISTKRTFSYHPSIENVYKMIDHLRAHISKHGLKSEQPPMLNIRTDDSTTYIAQVGLPVERQIPEADNISVKWMMKGGNILSGEVKGGPGDIGKGMKEFEKYILDYNRTIIAIPFQLLITDRSKEPDTAKWITRIYYPVI